MWFSLFDKLRLFAKTAFYIKLVFQTIKSSSQFFLIFFISIMAIGSSLFVLNQNRSDEDTIQTDITNVWVFDAVINQYLLALGSFDQLNNFAGHEDSVLIYIFFVIATFFTQITFLNMIISIMGDVYDEVREG